jgi:hypothetical protein
MLSAPGLIPASFGLLNAVALEAIAGEFAERPLGMRRVANESGSLNRAAVQ